jgi:hypothetical protein
MTFYKKNPTLGDVVARRTKKSGRHEQRGVIDEIEYEGLFVRVRWEDGTNDIYNVTNFRTYVLSSSLSNDPEVRCLFEPEEG